MTTVAEVIGSETPYTWQTAGFSWAGDTRARKSWEDAGIVESTIQVGETVNLAEVIGKSYTKLAAETFGVSDKMTFSYVLNVLRSLSIAETYTDNIDFIVRISESISFGEKLAKEFTLEEFEDFGLADHLARAFEKNHIEPLVIAEAFGRTVAYHIYLAESFTTTEAHSKTILLSKAEALTIFDEYRRRGNAVLSDMILATGDLDMVAFTQIIDSGHAPGFANFRDFIQGDYDYKQAIFRVVLKSINSDRARLKDVALTVDLPDVIESGSGTISNALTGVRVNFTRTFHIPPEVTLSFKGGSVVAIPMTDGEPDVGGFTGLLIDPSTGNRVTGAFTWSAHGY